MNRSNININEASREQLIDIVKQLRQQLRDAKNAAAPSNERLVELESQVSGLQDLIQDKNTELKALRHQNVMLSEKSVSDEETISALIKQMEVTQQAPTSDTALGGKATPAATDNKKAGARTPVLAAQSQPRELGGDNLASTIASLNTQLSVANATITRKNEDIANLEGKVRELMEVNTFYAAIVSQHDEEARSRYASPVITTTNEEEPAGAEPSELMKRIAVLEDHQDKFQRLMKQMEKERKTLIAENRQLLTEVNTLEGEMLEVERWQNEEAARHQQLKERQGSPHTAPVANAPERFAAKVIVSHQDSPNSSLEPNTTGSWQHNRNNIRALQPISIRNPTAKEKELLDRIHLYERYVGQQDAFEADRQKSFSEMEKTRADLFASLNDQLEKQRKEIQQLKKREPESGASSVTSNMEVSLGGNRHEEDNRLASRESSLHDCRSCSREASFQLEVVELASDEAESRIELLFEESGQYAAMVLQMYYVLDKNTFDVMQTLQSEKESAEARAANALKEVEDLEQQIVHLHNAEDKVAVQQEVGAPDEGVSVPGEGSSSSIVTQEEAQSPLLCHLSEAALESKTGIALQTLLSLYGDLLLAFVRINNSNHRPFTSCGDEEDDIQALQRDNALTLEEIQDIIGGLHTTATTSQLDDGSTVHDNMQTTAVYEKEDPKSSILDSLFGAPSHDTEQQLHHPPVVMMPTETEDPFLPSLLTADAINSNNNTVKETSADLFMPPTHLDDDKPHDEGSQGEEVEDNATSQVHKDSSEDGSTCMETVRSNNDTMGNDSQQQQVPQVAAPTVMDATDNGHHDDSISNEEGADWKEDLGLELYEESEEEEMGELSPEEEAELLRQLEGEMLRDGGEMANLSASSEADVVDTNSSAHDGAPLEHASPSESLSASTSATLQEEDTDAQPAAAAATTTTGDEEESTHTMEPPCAGDYNDVTEHQAIAPLSDDILPTETEMPHVSPSCEANQGDDEGDDTPCIEKNVCPEMEEELPIVVAVDIPKQPEKVDVIFTRPLPVLPESNSDHSDDDFEADFDPFQ